MNTPTLRKEFTTNKLQNNLFLIFDYLDFIFEILENNFSEYFLTKNSTKYRLLCIKFEKTALFTVYRTQSTDFEKSVEWTVFCTLALCHRSSIEQIRTVLFQCTTLPGVWSLWQVTHFKFSRQKTHQSVRWYYTPGIRIWHMGIENVRVTHVDFRHTRACGFHKSQGDTSLRLKICRWHMWICSRHSVCVD